MESSDDTEKTDTPTGEEATADTEKQPTPASEAPPASKKDSADTDDKIPKAAFIDQRKRRQSAERERDELRTKLDDIDKAEPTSVWTDEGKFRDEMKRDFDQALMNQTLNTSQFYVEREITKPVLEEKIETFRSLAADNPSLLTRFKEAISPYHELVQIVDQHGELDKMKDLDSYKATLLAEAKVQATKEIKADLDGKAKLRESIPKSLVDEPSAGSVESGSWGGPPTAESIYN